MLRKKIKEIFVFLIGISFFSCENVSNDIKLENTGSHHEIILVINDDIWSEKTGDILKDIFHEEIQGLPQSESKFKLIQINMSEFNRLFRTHKNIIFVDSKGENSYTKNKWAQDQIVMYLNCSSEKKFRENCQKAFNFIDRKEIESIKSSYKNGHNKKATEFINEQFGINVYVPTEYSTPIKSNKVFVADFHSFNEKEDIIKYILIFEIPNKKETTTQDLIFHTDSILKIYVKGEANNSYVEIDKRTELHTQSNQIYRGMWSLKNGFMAGPFIMKRYQQENKNIISIGLVFFPNQDKREFVRIFEAIL